MLKNGQSTKNLPSESFKEISRDWLKKVCLRLRSSLGSFLTILRKERVFFLIGGVVALVLLGALGFALKEAEGEGFLERFGNGLWWAAATLTTVGYGDVVPRTWGGRLVGFGVMCSGVIILSMLTATIASVFIERKFRKERGLENITERDHIIILGWHRGAEQILQNLLFRLDRRVPVVLVNDLPPEQFEPLKDKFQGRNLQYLRGDIAREEVLHKTNLAQARRVVILADRINDPPREQVDQRTLLAALAVKSLNSKVKICAELLNRDNRPHLERAHVEDIIIRGEYDSALIASATDSAGLFKILQTLLASEGPNFWAVEIPHRFHGGALKEFAAFLKTRHQALLIGLFSEGQKIRLEQLLSTEPDAIDNFIFRKFTESGLTHLFGRRKIEFSINPPEDHILSPHEVAVVIATEFPTAVA